MRYIEYIYLTLAGMSFTFMVTEYERLAGYKLVFILLAMGIFSFMFAFRRNQRIRFEKMEAEEMEQLQAELAEWAEEQEEARKAKSTPEQDEPPAS